ncbi:MAG: HEAT repeat domain-containing protein [Verrucomicrobiota bacterium]
MNCQSARDVFPALLDRRTAATDHLEARTHLGGCPDCQREFAALSQTLAALDAMPTPAPSPRLRKNFYAMLEEEKHSAASAEEVVERRQRARQVSLWRWVISPLAGCALLALGFLLGNRNQPTTNTSTLPAPVVAAADDSTKREIAALREQIAAQNSQLNKMTTLVGYSLLHNQQNPANERLQEVLLAARDEQPSDKVIDDLIQALNLDPSANVRLRALEALYRHADRDAVRASVLAALPREQNPLVQLELIDFIASSQATDAAPTLERMLADESVEPPVRDAARLALAQL